MNLFEKKKLNNNNDSNLNDLYKGMRAGEYLNNLSDNTLEIGRKF